jgi:general secretion pathway protein D
MSGCARTPQKPGPGHLDRQEVTNLQQGAIPTPVRHTPVVPEPQPAVAEESFDVVVTGVAVDQLLFSLARDANINIDVYPGLTGQVTLNAIDQTLLQILDRVAAQVSIRYRFDDNLLVVEPDQPYVRTYYVDYVNMVRNSSSNSSVSTQIVTTGGTAVGESGGGGDASNDSATVVQSSTQNLFWENLRRDLGTMLGAAQDAEGGNSIIVNAETGLVSVRATDAQHRIIQNFLDRLMRSAQRQVLIEATVVEVELNDNYQFGVDWSRLADNGTGLSFAQDLLGSNLSDPPVTTLEFFKDSNTWGQITATVKMLQEFGNVKVLSSPKIMAINNQTALLKVVDNLVYFTTEAETSQAQTSSVTSFTTTPHTVSVGFVMAVTAQISNGQAVILSIRPTISRVTSFVQDPNPALAAQDIVSEIPQIQVREMESVMRVRSGQLTVLGGLIQDSIDLNDQGIPSAMELDLIGDAFTYRNNKIKKSELVIFLKTRVIASIDESLDVYRNLLPDLNKPMGSMRASDRSAWQ